GRGRPRPVSGPVGTEPGHHAFGGAANPPSVLVNQTLVEPAHEQQVVELGGAAARPPSDVVCVRESPGPARREAAFAVAMAERPHHRRGGLPARPADAHRIPERILDDGLKPARADQTFRSLRVNDAAALDLASAL